MDFKVNEIHQIIPSLLIQFQYDCGEHIMEEWVMIRLAH